MSDKIPDLLKRVEESLDLNDQIITELNMQIREKNDAMRASFRKAAERLGWTNVDPKKLDEFLDIWEKRPYAVFPRKEGEWTLAIPLIWPIAYGWWERQEGAYNYYVVNRFFDMIQPIPPALKEELDLSRPFDGIVVDAGLLTLKRPDRDDIRQVQKRYSKFLTQKPLDNRSIAVRKGQEFSLIAALIRDGILPFVPKPVDKSDLLNRHCKLTLRDYQERDYKTFLRTGAVGIFYAMGMGKTILALEAMCQIRGPKLVLVPTLTLKEQWLERIQEHTTLAPDEYRVEVYHQRLMAKLASTKWSLVVYDEMHRIAANSWLQLATVPTKYRLNLTGTPFREDGRMDIVWALSGLPLGVDWTYFLDLGLIVRPKITVRVTKDMRGKFDYVDEVIDEKKKTLIFSDSLELGESLAKRHHIPFVHGGTAGNERLEMIRSNEKLVISRVGDLGISVGNLQRVIEFSFLFGSRAQEMQRLGRLFHSEYKGEHVVLMTADEYIHHKKRLFGVYEKGFEIEIVRGEGVPTNLSDLSLNTPAEPAIREPRAPVVRATVQSSDDPSQFPMFDERRQLDKSLILEMLGSDYVRKRGGVQISTLRAIIEHNHIKYKDYGQLKHLVQAMFAGYEVGGRTSGQARIYFLTNKEEG